MTAKAYQALGDFFRRTPARRFTLYLVAKLFPWLNAGVYVGLLVALAVRRDSALLRCILVPAALFLTVTVVRAVLNRPRPYDELDYEPFFLVHRGKGKSFPSRHSASAVIIALASLYSWVPLGIVMVIIALCICGSRIAAGAHYPRDVAVGILLSVLFGWIGFWLI